MPRVFFARAVFLFALPLVAQVQPSKAPCKLTKAQKFQNWQEKMQHKPLTNFCPAPAPPDVAASEPVAAAPISEPATAAPASMMAVVPKTEIVQGTLTLGASPSYTDPSGKVTPLTAFKNGQPGAYDADGNYYVKQTINGTECIVKGSVPAADRPAADQSVNTQLNAKHERKEDASVVAHVNDKVAPTDPFVAAGYDKQVYTGTISTKYVKRGFTQVRTLEMTGPDAGAFNTRIAQMMATAEAGGKAYEIATDDGVPVMKVVKQDDGTIAVYSRKQ